MASAIAAVEVVVDSKTDPRQRPTNSNDPGWNYAYSTTIGNRDAVTCKLCGRSLKRRDMKVEGASCRWIW